MSEGTPTDPGGTGDPYITRLDGAVFEFTGEPMRVYDLYSRGGLRVLPRLAPVEGQPGRSCICGVDVLLPGGGKVVVLGDGRTHVIAAGHHVTVASKHCTLDAPGHFGSTSDEPHPLQGVPHLNVTMRHPGDAAAGATGLTVDGADGCDPHAYEVPAEEIP